MREQLVIRKRARERDVELALQKTVQQFLGKLSVTAIYGATLGSVFTPLGQKYFVAEVERYLGQVVFVKVLLLIVTDQNKRVGFLFSEPCAQKVQTLSHPAVSLLAILQAFFGNVRIDRRIFAMTASKPRPRSFPHFVPAAWFNQCVSVGGGEACDDSSHGPILPRAVLA
jgi:hypothetical protein